MDRLFQVLVIPHDYPGPTSILLLEGLMPAEPPQPDDMGVAKAVGLVQPPLTRMLEKPFTLTARCMLRESEHGGEPRTEIGVLFRRPYIVDLRGEPAKPKRYDPALHQF